MRLLRFEPPPQECNYSSHPSALLEQHSTRSALSVLRVQGERLLYIRNAQLQSLEQKHYQAIESISTTLRPNSLPRREKLLDGSNQLFVVIYERTSPRKLTYNGLQLSKILRKALTHPPLQSLVRERYFPIPHL